MRSFYAQHGFVSTLTGRCFLVAGSIAVYIGAFSYGIVEGTRDHPHQPIAQTMDTKLDFHPVFHPCLSRLYFIGLSGRVLWEMLWKAVLEWRQQAPTALHSTTTPAVWSRKPLGLSRHDFPVVNLCCVLPLPPCLPGCVGKCFPGGFCSISCLGVG